MKAVSDTPHGPGPEGPPQEGLQHDLPVLSVSYVRLATKAPLSLHKKAHGIGPGPSRSPDQVLGGALLVALQVKREKVLEDLLVRDVQRPLVRGEDRHVETVMETRHL